MRKNVEYMLEHDLIEPSNSLCIYIIILPCTSIDIINLSCQDTHYNSFYYFDYVVLCSVLWEVIIKQFSAIICALRMLLEPERRSHY